MITALLLIFAHYVADFICQSDAMARGKSKSNYWLTLHVLTYMLVMAIPCSMIFFAYGVHFAGGMSFVTVVTYPMVMYWLLINGFLHFLTDYFTSRWSSKYFTAGDYHNGFAVVGFDQCIHYTCLFLTARMVIG